jgi:sialic acid synthase SpsE
MISHSQESYLTQLKNIASTYATNKIYIVGKGPSIDDIDSEILKDSLVIGINDAERILPADVSVLHAEWVIEALKTSGFNSELYISPFDFEAGNSKVCVCPYVKMTQENSDLLMQRFMSDLLYIEDILVITALKLAKIIADVRGENQEVYMLGFDFDPNVGQSLKIGKDYSTDQVDEAALKISVQEYYFVNALYFLKDSSVIVKHVGSRNFSSLSVSDFNSLSTPIHKSEHVGQVNVVAELTTNHFGDRQRLERMIRLAKAAGANYIKLQKRNVDTFYSKEQLSSPYVSPFGKTFADYRYQLELTQEDLQFVQELCGKLNIGWFASVLDEDSFKFIQEFSPELIKLPSTISEKKEYLKYVSDHWAGGLVLSTGMTDSSYEQFILENFSNCSELYLLQCNSAYPTPLHDCNIAVVRHYHELSKQDTRIKPGYSSHDFGWEASALAVAAGARMVEKHVKLGNTEWAHFDAVAVDLTTQNFNEYVRRIRETELILGSSEKKINASEHHKY